jgi:hypothetical protein
MPESWHTEMEKRLIEARGGEWHQQYGVDGELADGSPVEVRVADEDNRFRLGKDVHRELVSKEGSYIFDVKGDGQPAREVPASEVSDMLGRGNWFDDRGYKRRFLDTGEIF